MSESQLAEVTVSIVAYNSRRVLAAAREQLNMLPQLIIVDNASSDDTPAWAAENLPRAQVLMQAVNMGFGRAHNLAVSRCTTPYALLLNPDCRIEAAAIAALVDCAQRYPDALLVAPLLVYPDGRAQENHRRFFHQKAGPRRPYQAPAGDLCTDMISGAVLLVNVASFRKIGGFDPWFFLYWEDEELCIRARQHHLASVLCHSAVACHVAQTSSTPNMRTSFIRHYSYTSSKLYLRRKLGEPVLLVAARGLATLLSSVLALLASALLGKREKSVRSAARITAVLTAPWQLRRAQAVATPGELF